MRADYLSYQRATRTSLLGLGIQAVLALSLLAYAARYGDFAALIVALFMGLGCAVWLTLAIVFDQHRRERVESIEADALMQQQGASVFQSTGDEFKVAARRVQFLHRFVIPITSLLFGAALLGVGYAAYRAVMADNGRRLDPSNFRVDARGLAIAIELVIAAVGFVLARYVAGMAKQPAWSMLRAGAGQAVGAALMCLTIVIGHFIDLYGPDAFLRNLQVVLPVALMVLGAEVFVSFLLELYRPRKAGEFARPAFDSRLMSFAAAPDRIAESISDAINYQFGYNVSSTWLYQLVSRSLSVLLLTGLGVAWLLSCLTVIQPHQRGLILRNGKIDREVGPGLHFKLPWPIDVVELPRFFSRDDRGNLVEGLQTTTGLRVLQLGTPPAANRNDGPILWTNEHATNEVFFLVQTSALDVAASSARSGADTGNDLAIIAMEMPLAYAVSDVERYERLAPPEERDDLLKTTAQRVVFRELATFGIDQVLGVQRSELAPMLREKIAKAFEQLNPGPDGKPMGAGVEILSLSIMGVHPHQTAAPAFERVVQQQQATQGLLETARSQAASRLIAVAGSEELAKQIVAEIKIRDDLVASNASAEQRRAQDFKIQELLDKAQGRVASLLAEAKSQRWKTHMSERARAAEYTGLVQSYLASPRLFKTQLYLDAMKQAMSRSRVFITDDRVANTWFNVDLQDKELGNTVFSELTAESVSGGK